MTDAPTNSTAAVRGYVDRFEALYRHQESLAEDLAELTEEIKEADVSAKDLAAMRKVAKLRINNKLEKAKDELAALNRVSEAVGMSLFDFMG